MIKHSRLLVVLVLVPVLVLSIFLLIPPAIAAPPGTGTFTTNGTIATGAQSNVTILDTNNTWQITAWNIGNGIKTFTIHVFNSSDTLTFNLYNNTPNMIYELRVNSTAIQGYQADDLGLVTFRYVQPNGNRSYDIRPATVQGGINFTWSWFRDIIIKNGTLENVWMTNVTQVIVNVITLNATEITGNGSRIYGLNASNITYGKVSDNRLSDNVLLGSNTTVLRDSNDSIIVRQKVDSCTGASDALGWNGTGLDCRTIPVSTTAVINFTTSNVTLDANQTYLANASTSELVLVLPDASKNGGKYYTVVYSRSRMRYEYGGNNNTNNVSIVSTLGQNISSNKHYNLTSVGDSVSLQSNGNNWSIVDTRIGCGNCLVVESSNTAQGSKDGSFVGSGNGIGAIKWTLEIKNRAVTGTWSVRYGFAVEGVGSTTHYSRVYLNGAPLGMLHQTNTIYTTDYDNVNEQFNIPLYPNDKIQIWSFGGSADTPWFRDFNISYSYVNATPSYISTFGG